MHIVKTANSNFGNRNQNIKQATGKQPELPEDDADFEHASASKKQLITTQDTDYKRFIAGRWRSYSPFIAQYINQRNSKRSRAFIGRKSAYSAQKIYKNSVHAVKTSTDSILDQIV